MNRLPGEASRTVELVSGVSAVSPGLLWLHDSRALVAADVHLAYEDVIGGALPTWSTNELIATLLLAVRTMQAREIVLLGDIIHGSMMSEGAARAVRSGLDALRGAATLTLVAGNHEGRSRGAAVLGETVEAASRDGWLLLHGDRAPTGSQFAAHRGVVIGHLHPSVHAGGSTAPAFLNGERIVVVPALTPYSGGLNVMSDECLAAIAPFNAGRPGDLCVTAVAGELLYPFGSLSELRRVMTQPAPAPRSSRYTRKFLKPD